MARKAPSKMINVSLLSSELTDSTTYTKKIGEHTFTGELVFVYAEVKQLYRVVYQKDEDGNEINVRLEPKPSGEDFPPLEDGWHSRVRTTAEWLECVLTDTGFPIEDGNGKRLTPTEFVQKYEHLAPILDEMRHAIEVHVDPLLRQQMDLARLSSMVAG